VRGEAKSQLSAGGVAHYYQAGEVEVKAGVFLLEKTVGGADIFEGAGPSSAGVADAAIFGVKGCDAAGAQRFAKVSGVVEIVLCAPIASMDV
jgi:hypothetical protein